MDKTTLIERFNLMPHPEGGYYAETYRSSETYVPDRLKEERNLSTAIYFMLEAGIFSAFHRIKSDELWHHYHGKAVTIHVIDEDGRYHKKILGKNIANGEAFQHTVKAGSWFASELSENEGYALVGCTVSFGFDFKDFELATSELIDIFPQHSTVLKRLIRD